MAMPYLQVYFHIEHREISIPIIELDSTHTQLIDVWKIYIQVWCRVQIILKYGDINQFDCFIIKLISLHAHTFFPYFSFEYNTKTILLDSLLDTESALKKI